MQRQRHKTVPLINGHLLKDTRWGALATQAASLCGYMREARIAGKESHRSKMSCALDFPISGRGGGGRGVKEKTTEEEKREDRQGKTSRQHSQKLFPCLAMAKRSSRRSFNTLECPWGLRQMVLEVNNVPCNWRWVVQGGRAVHSLIIRRAPDP